MFWHVMERERRQMLWPGEWPHCHAWDAECWWPGLVRILVAVVHYWDPEGSGHHGSLRPNPRPRIEAFQQQLLGLMRLSERQAQLTMKTLTADPANKAFQHQIDIKVITDGEHHVLNQLDPPFQGLFQMVVTEPEGPKHLGFEAQRFLASRLDEAYDLYAYFEDDLIILDPGFFGKLIGFAPMLAMIVCCCHTALNSPRFLMLSTGSSLMAPLRTTIYVE